MPNFFHSCIPDINPVDDIVMKFIKDDLPKLQEMSRFNNLKNKVVCSLFKSPLANNKIIAGVFNDSGQILDLFESE